jgi:hypothetical protein
MAHGLGLGPELLKVTIESNLQLTVDGRRASQRVFSTHPDKSSWRHADAINQPLDAAPQCEAKPYKAGWTPCSSDGTRGFRGIEQREWFSILR